MSSNNWIYAIVGIVAICTFVHMAIYENYSECCHVLVVTCIAAFSTMLIILPIRAFAYWWRNTPWGNPLDLFR